MRRLLIYLLITTSIIACDSEDAGDCFQTAGSIIQQEFTVDSFEKILIHEGIELIIKEGLVQKVVVETGKNLMNDVQVEVIDNKLIATNKNKCNFVRDYGLTKVYVTSPNITEIRNSSELSVRSEGILTFPNLTLLAEDYQNDFLNIGDFYLTVDNSTVYITCNGIANFYISGKTTNLRVGFFAGDSRFEGKDLIATNVVVTSKSSNDMLVNPQEKITGDIYSLGDVIAFNKPPTIEVTEHYKGKLIFK